MSARGFTVALVGPDGAGKTSVARRLVDTVEPPVSYRYLGVNPAAGGRPLARLMRHRRTVGPSTTGTGLARSPGRWRVLRSAAWTASLMVEEWWHAIAMIAAERRGAVVICDRHFRADYHAHDVRGGRALPFTRRLHGRLLERLYPRPALTVVLDASVDVLLSRRPEEDPDHLSSRRREYLLAAEELPGEVVVIDADRPLEVVVTDVGARIDARRRRPGGSPVPVRVGSRR